jgi:hypothetical protein
MSATFTDAYGRTVTMTTDGVHDTYNCNGFVLVVPAGELQAKVLDTINAMAPGN